MKSLNKPFIAIVVVVVVVLGIVAGWSIRNSVSSTNAATQQDAANLPLFGRALPPGGCNPRAALIFTEQTWTTASIRTDTTMAFDVNSHTYQSSNPQSANNTAAAMVEVETDVVQDFKDAHAVATKETQAAEEKLKVAVTAEAKAKAAYDDAPTDATKDIWDAAKGATRTQRSLVKNATNAELAAITNLERSADTLKQVTAYKAAAAGYVTQPVSKDINWRPDGVEWLPWRAQKGGEDECRHVPSTLIGTNAGRQNSDGYSNDDKVWIGDEWWGTTKRYAAMAGVSGYVQWECGRGGNSRVECADKAFENNKYRSRWDTDRDGQVGQLEGYRCETEVSNGARKILGCYTEREKQGAWHGSWNFKTTAFAPSQTIRIDSSAAGTDKKLILWKITDATTSGEWPGRKSPVGIFVAPSTDGSATVISSWAGADLGDQSMSITLEPVGIVAKDSVQPKVTLTVRSSLGSSGTRCNNDNRKWDDAAPTCTDNGEPEMAYPKEDVTVDGSKQSVDRSSTCSWSGGTKSFLCEAKGPAAESNRRNLNPKWNFVISGDLT